MRQWFVYLNVCVLYIAFMGIVCGSRSCLLIVAVSTLMLTVMLLSLGLDNIDAWLFNESMDTLQRFKYRAKGLGLAFCLLMTGRVLGMSFVDQLPQADMVLLHVMAGVLGTILFFWVHAGTFKRIILRPQHA